MDKIKTKSGKLINGQEMPKDFWNYKVNPILGYRLDPQLKTR